MSDRDFSVSAAVLRDLEEIAERDPRLAESSLAMSALRLANELDSQSSATSKSMCAKTLLETMDRLRELSPPEEKKGQLHDIKSGRALRLAAGSSRA